MISVIDVTCHSAASSDPTEICERLKTGQVHIPPEGVQFRHLNAIQDPLLASAETRRPAGIGRVLLRV